MIASKYNNYFGQVHKKCVKKKTVQFKCRKCSKALRNMENTSVPNVANGVEAENTAALEVANGPEDEDTTVQEVANDLCLVPDDTIVLPTFVKKRKQDALHISILLEASFMKDIDGLMTQKGK